MSAVITFDSISPSSISNKLDVLGTFPAGLIRGVGAFEFSLRPTAHDKNASVLEFSNVRIFGVELKGYLRLISSAFPESIGTDVAMLRRVSHWEDGSIPAHMAMRTAGNMIREAMLGSDLVASAVAHNTNTAAQEDESRLDREIIELEKNMEELRAKRALVPDLRHAKLNRVSLSLVAHLVSDGVHYGEAFAAAAAIVGEAQ